jgi:antitoxin component YwqK of YwqJK toxin-antitoxin module
MDDWLGDTDPPADFSGMWVRNRSGPARREIEYEGGVPNGRVREWNGDGRLLLEGFVKNGQWHGPLTRWGTDGELLDVSHFDQGTGIYRIFFSSGKLAREIHLKSGKPHGVTKCWNSRGELVSEELYRDGTLVHSSNE